MSTPTDCPSREVRAHRCTHSTALNQLNLRLLCAKSDICRARIVCHRNEVR
jgi:hypothetical protein